MGADTLSVEADALSFGYQAPDDVISGFSWRVHQGEWWSIVGPSGCGKTTLLYLLAGLRQPRAGSLLVQGQPVHQPRASTGLILQDFGLLPWARVGENVDLGLRLRRLPAAERNRLVHHWLQRLGIDGLRDRYVSQLSGGQRQRVAIARTLALDPDLLLMDEPFGSLDAFIREGLQDLVASLGEERARTCIVVTHDIQEAVYLGSRILVLGHRPIQEALVVENPLARQAGFREDPEFYRQCSEVRALALAAQRQSGAEPRYRPIPVRSER